MCLGIPGQVIASIPGAPDLAVVRVEGVDRPVNTGLLDDGELVVGEWVLIHLGFAMSRIDEAQATASLNFVTGRDGAFADGAGTDRAGC